jgi:hypothetical protein
MRARARLAATTLTSLTLLGGAAACSGEAPEVSQVEENEAPNNVDTGEDESDDEG